jgi:hypothetical protein
VSVPLLQSERHTAEKHGEPISVSALLSPNVALHGILALLRAGACGTQLVYDASALFLPNVALHGILALLCAGACGTQLV